MICSYKNNEVPSWLRFPNIIFGYRYGGNKQSCLQSLFMWHNETVNAWTMILLNILSLYCFYKNCFRNDLTPYIALSLSTILHLPFSLGYHLFMPISETTLIKWRERDLIMALISICMQIYALNYFIFQKSITNFVFVLNLSIVYKTWEQKKRILDKGIYMKYVIENILPLQFFYLIPIFYSNNMFFIKSFLFFCITGSMVYLKQFPEKYWPGKFDLLGSSHQIMHLILIVIHLLHYKFVEFYDSNIYLDSNGYKNYS